MNKILLLICMATSVQVSASKLSLDDIVKSDISFFAKPQIGGGWYFVRHQKITDLGGSVDEVKNSHSKFVPTYQVSAGVRKHFQDKDNTLAFMVTGGYAGKNKSVEMDYHEPTDTDGPEFTSVFDVHHWFIVPTLEYTFFHRNDLHCGVHAGLGLTINKLLDNFRGYEKSSSLFIGQSIKAMGDKNYILGRFGFSFNKTCLDVLNLSLQYDCSISQSVFQKQIGQDHVHSTANHHNDFLLIDGSELVLTKNPKFLAGSHMITAGLSYEF